MTDKIGRHGQKHGVVAVVLSGGFEDELFPLCKKAADGGGDGYDGGSRAEEGTRTEGSTAPSEGREGGEDGEVEGSLIPLANTPLLLYPLLRLEDLFTPAGLRSVAIACTSEEEAGAVRRWVHQRYASQPSRPHVIAISGETAVSDADVVAQAFHQGLGSEFDLAKNVIVMRGNLVSDVQLEAVVASHRLRNATATVMLARPRDEQTVLTSSKKGGKAVVAKPSKSKAPKTYVGLDDERKRLCLWMSEASMNGGKPLPNGKMPQVKQLQLPRRVLKSVGHVNISSNLIDTELAVFNRDVFDGRIAAELMQNDEGLGSVSGHLIPHLVKQQFDNGAKEGKLEQNRGESGDKGAATGVKMSLNVDRGSGEGGSGHDRVALELSTKKSNHGSSGDQLSFEKLQEVIAEMTHCSSVGEKTSDGQTRTLQEQQGQGLCSVYIVPPENYCAKVDTIETYGEISKDLTSAEFGHLLPSTTTHSQPTEIGSKTTIGSGCLFGDGVKLGDKCSVKRSILGTRCTLGNNVKIVNSVIMDGTVIGDGSHIQNCVLCKFVKMGEKCTLKDCNLGAHWALEDEMEHRGETLAHGHTL